MFEAIKIGEKVKSVAIERYKGQKDGRDVIAILSNDIAGVQVHYHDNTGSFYCNKGRCCHELGLPQVRYIIPVLVYTVTQFPRVYGGPVHVKYLQLGRDAYESDILTKQAISGDLTKFDLAAICTDSQYQKISFDIMPGPNMYRKKESGLFQIVQELYQDYSHLIEMSVARTIDEATLIKLLNQEPSDKGNKRNAPAPAPQAQQYPQRAIQAPPPRRTISNAPAQAPIHQSAPVAGLQGAEISTIEVETVDINSAIESMSLATPPSGAPGAKESSIPVETTFEDLLGEPLAPSK